MSLIHSLVRDLQLGWRFATSAGSRSVVRLGLSAVAGAVAVVLLAGGLATMSAMASQEERYKSTLEYEFEDPDLSAPLLMGVREETYRGERVTVKPVVVTGGNPPLAPGVRSWPKPGQMLATPAFAEALASDPTLRERFPQELAGVIERAGVVSPAELRVYVGVRDYPGADKEMRKAQGFGPTPFSGKIIDFTVRHTWTDFLTPERVLLLLVVLYVLLPLAVFVGMSTRLSAATRDRRLAALRVVGFSARRCQIINAVETVAATTIGAVVGLIMFLLLRGARDAWWIGPVGAYASDLELSGDQVLVLLVGVALFAAIVSAVAVGPTLRNPFGVARRSARVPSRWRWLLPTAGAAALAVSVMVGPADPNAGPTAYLGLLPAAVGAIALVVGFVLVLPRIMRVVGRAMSRSPNPLAVRLSGATLHHDGAAGTWVLGGVLISLCVAGTGAMLTASTRAEAALPDPFADRVIATHIDGPVDAATKAALRDLPGVTGLGTIQLATATGPKGRDYGGQAIVAACSDVRDLFDGARKCRDGKVYRVKSPPRGEHGEVAQVPRDADLVVRPYGRDGAKHRVLVPDDAPTMRLVLRSPVVDYHAIALVTPGALPDDWPKAAGTGSNFVSMLITGGYQTADKARAVLSARSPAAQLSGPLSVRTALDPATLVPILVALAIITWSLGGLSLLVAAIDDGLRRRREQTALTVVGLSPSLLKSANAVRLLVPMLVGGAGVLTVTVASSAVVLHALGKPPDISLASVPVILAGTLILSAVLVAVAYLSGIGRISAEDLRRE